MARWWISHNFSLFETLLTLTRHGFLCISCDCNFPRMKLMHIYLNTFCGPLLWALIFPAWCFLNTSPNFPPKNSLPPFAAKIPRFTPQGLWSRKYICAKKNHWKNPTKHDPQNSSHNSYQIQISYPKKSDQQFLLVGCAQAPEPGPENLPGAPGPLWGWSHWWIQMG